MASLLNRLFQSDVGCQPDQHLFHHSFPAVERGFWHEWGLLDQSGHRVGPCRHLPVRGLPDRTLAWEVPRDEDHICRWAVCYGTQLAWSGYLCRAVGLAEHNHLHFSLPDVLLGNPRVIFLVLRGRSRFRHCKLRGKYRPLGLRPHHVHLLQPIP